MTWPRDDAKLARVRGLMDEADLDALVVRAPDNVLYLSNFWGMKGYDAVVFPRDGEPVLICLKVSADAAARTAWTTDVRFLTGYDEKRPSSTDRPNAGGVALDAPPRTSASASSCRSAPRRPTRWSASRPPSPRRGSTPSPARPTRLPVLNAARAIKTAQEIERMRLANEIAAAAMEHVAELLRPA